MKIELGTTVEAQTADGSLVTMRALGAPEQGHDFRIVWVCTEDEFVRASNTASEPVGIPWPLNAVRAVGR